MVRLVMANGYALDAELIDRSLKGMRVRLDDAGALSPEIKVVSVANAAIYETRVMWRSPPYAGLQLTRTVDMRAPAAVRDAEVQSLWRRHARA